MRPIFTIGKPLPESPTYKTDATARAFWRVSYRVGRDYLDSLDARGEPILVKHEREKPDAYSRRRRITKARNHCGPIIRRYNDFVFRRSAELPEDTGPIYGQIVIDADGRGTPLTVFLRRVLLRAEIERECYLLPDSTAPSDGLERSVAQAQEMEIRPLLRTVDPDAVIWWHDSDGVLDSALVLMVDDEGKTFARLYEAKTYTDIALKDRAEGSRVWVVDAVGETRQHSYGACPLVRVRPLFDQTDDKPGESQISPMAESQQMIANLLALLYEEICNVTFTQIVATGVSADSVKDVDVGNNRLICLPNPQAAFETIGADPAQAKTICAAIEDEQRELYRQAGIAMGDPLTASGSAESGVAKAFKFNDLAANLSALADAIEHAHNEIMRRVCVGNGEQYPGDAIYPSNFDLPDYAGEMTTLIQTVSTSTLPGVIREVAVKEFAKRNLSLDETQEQKLDDQLANIDAVAESANSSNPFQPVSRMAST